MVWHDDKTERTRGPDRYRLHGLSSRLNGTEETNYKPHADSHSIR
jgi:hypothetical protein